MENQKRLTKILDCGNEFVNSDFLVEKLKKNEGERMFQIVHYQLWLTGFEKCKKNPAYFVNNPQLIDDIILEIKFLTSFFSEEEWRELFIILRQMQELADETKDVRQKIIEFNN